MGTNVFVCNPPLTRPILKLQWLVRSTQPNQPTNCPWWACCQEAAPALLLFQAAYSTQEMSLSVCGMHILGKTLGGGPFLPAQAAVSLGGMGGGLCGLYTEDSWPCCDWTFADAYGLITGRKSDTVLA